MRLTPSIGVVSVVTQLAPAVGDEGAVLGTPTPVFDQRCGDFCTALVSDANMHDSCQHLCEALEAQRGVPCIQALENSTEEYLTLLSYSSGHYIEEADMMRGGTHETNPAYNRFTQKALLNDRGSPAACHTIDGAHYCLVQGSSGISLGLCLPETCDSASVTKILANISSISSYSAHAMVDNASSSDHGAAEQTFSYAVCGAEFRFHADAGMVLALVVVCFLFILTIVGTLLDYQQQPHVQKHSVDGNRRLPPADDARLPSNKQGLVVAPNFPISTSTPQEDVSPHITSGLLSDVDGGRVLAITDDTGREKGELSSTPRIDDGTCLLQYSVGGDHGSRDDAPGEPLLIANPRELSLRCSSTSTRLLSREGSPEDSSSWWIQCLRCFSLRKNIRKLLAPPPPSNAFVALDGVRTLSNLWVILLHVVVCQVYSIGGLTNAGMVLPIDGHGVLASAPGQVVLGGLFAVDSFFMISGFLASVTLLPSLESGSPRLGSWVLGRWWHRYLRLMPTTAFVRLALWQLFPLVSDGPAWWSFAKSVKDDCRRYWWTEITFLQNLVSWFPQPFFCVGVAWSLGVEMQCFLGAAPLIALFHYRPRVSVATLVTILLVSCSYTLWFAFHRDVRFPMLHSFFLGHDWFQIYTSPVSRCPTYIMGLLGGMAWHTHLSGRLVPSGHKGPGGRGASNPLLVREGSFDLVVLATSVLLTALPVFGAYWADRDLHEVRIPAWADHLYLAFSRPSFALGVALLCGLCFFGRGGAVNWFLSLSIWTPLSRLTFCCYLVHLPLIWWLYNSRSLPIRFTYFEVTITLVGMAGVSFALSVVVHLLVEAPFRNLESWVKKGRGVLKADSAMTEVSVERSAAARRTSICRDSAVGMDGERGMSIPRPHVDIAPS